MTRAPVFMMAGLALLAPGPAAAQEHCPLTAIGTVKVAAVRDGRTVLLADGRTLRLAAIEVSEQSRAALQARSSQLLWDISF